MIIRRAGVVVLILVGAACGRGEVTGPVVAPIPTSSTTSTSAPMTTTATTAPSTTTTTMTPSTTPTTSTVPATTSTVPAHAVGRDTRLALVECGRLAGTLTLGLAAGRGDLDTLDTAKATCQRASDLLDVAVLVARRILAIAHAEVEIAVQGTASDDLLNATVKWSDDFTEAMRLLS
jgi:hypothetical protein